MPELSKLQKIVSWVMHASLYVFKLAVPLAGWLCLSAQSQAVPFLGMELPALMSADPHAADVLEAAHETLVRMLPRPR